MRIPMTEKEAYENGLSCHNEGQNPFRNRGYETDKLNIAWFKGFNEVKEERESEL